MIAGVGTPGTAAVRYDGVSKSFPGVQALQDVSFEVAPGTCHALCGENGAGKSTLSKLLAGIYRPDEGRIELHGQAVDFHEPRAALAAGVAMVHQELAFCENMTVAENLLLGHLPRGRGMTRVVVDRREMERQAAAMIAEVTGNDDLRIDTRRTIADLTVGERQLLQIASAVGSGASVLILDEPTSSLSEYEAQHLYDLIARLKARHVTMLYVSHRMHEIFHLCEAATVLRDGRHVATRPIGEYTESDMVRLMVGRTVTGYTRDRTGAPSAEPAKLSVTNLSSPGKFAPISFAVRPGEIVGFAGLVGAGRSYILEALFGLDEAATGAVTVDNAPMRLGTPLEAMRRGLGFVPEDRKRQGLVLSLSCRDNTTLPFLRRLASHTWVRRSEEKTLTQHYFAQLNVRSPSTEAIVGGLSGGNQQKIVLAKWLAAGCQVLLLDEPTRGVDVGAKAEIHALIDSLAKRGAAIVLVSSELPELLSLADRVLVMREGTCVAELPGHSSQDVVLRDMTGVLEAHDHHSSEV